MAGITAARRNYAPARRAGRGVKLAFLVTHMYSQTSSSPPCEELSDSAALLRHQNRIASVSPLTLDVLSHNLYPLRNTNQRQISATRVTSLIILSGRLFSSVYSGREKAYEGLHSGLNAAGGGY